MIVDDGTLYEGKLSRTVWGGGKLGDNIKGLPITIGSGDPFCVSDFHHHRAAVYLVGHLRKKLSCYCADNVHSVRYMLCYAVP